MLPPIIADYYLAVTLPHTMKGTGREKVKNPIDKGRSISGWGFRTINDEAAEETNEGAFDAPYPADVIPAKAGIQPCGMSSNIPWLPDQAGHDNGGADWGLLVRQHWAYRVIVDAGLHRYDRGVSLHPRERMSVSGGREEALVGAAGADLDVDLAEAAGAVALVGGGGAVAVDALVGVAAFKIDADVGAGGGFFGADVGLDGFGGIW